MRIRAIKNALFYSLSGLRYLLRERAFSQELAVFISLAVVELFRNTPLLWRLYMFSAYVLILLAEAMNSAIETTVDRVSLGKHELSKKAKDIASAAVFIAIIHFAIVWILSWM
ncbi:MAG: diacylglycerol kinase [Alphaproteobacteria bacterium]|nr:diacylglycerol kinase [Alphaproteobacteria bacterium]